MSRVKTKASEALQKREDGKIVIKLRPANTQYKALLSIDGGGVRGIIPAIVLGGFEQAVKNVAKELFPEIKDIDDEELVVNTNDYFDMIAGNSAGSILTLFLSSGGGSKTLYEEGQPLYGMEPGSSKAAVAMTTELVKDTFKKTIIAKIPLISKLAGLFCSKYGSDGMAKALKVAFEDINMSQLQNNTLVTAYELNNARSVMFYKQIVRDISTQGYIFPSEGKSMELIIEPTLGQVPGAFEARNFDVPARIACQASASAPVYFDPLTFSRPGLAQELGLQQDTVTWADGGLVSNNPTMVALSILGAIYSSGKPVDTLLPLEKMAVLSLGTGTKREPVKVGGGKGLASWGAELISVLMSANTRQSHNIVEGVLEGKMFGNIQRIANTYLRINKVADPGDKYYGVIGSLDSVDDLPGLEEIGKSLIDDPQTMTDMEAFVENILMKEAKK